MSTLREEGDAAPARLSIGREGKGREGLGSCSLPSRVTGLPAPDSFGVGRRGHGDFALAILLPPFVGRGDPLDLVPLQRTRMDLGLHGVKGGILWLSGSGSLDPPDLAGVPVGQTILFVRGRRVFKRTNLALNMFAQCTK